jgi:NADH dehydrogenase
MDRHRVVIVGGGFGGLRAAKQLGGSAVDVTLLDRENYHLFQPLLYQVATGGLSPANIATPLRAIVKRHANIRVLLAEVVDLDSARSRVITRDGEVAYDTLIVAAGARSFYFGHDDWERVAPGLKSVEDATLMRRRILLAFEAAEQESQPERCRAWLTFVLVGGGPTGVELAGAIAELCHHTLARDFRKIDTRSARVLLIEASSRVLSNYPESLSIAAEQSLARLGATVWTDARVEAITEDAVTVRFEDRLEVAPARTVFFTAGVAASPLGKVLAERLGASVDRGGRVIVEPDLSVAGHPEVLVIGDLANFQHGGLKSPLPGVAPVAMQEGAYAARLILARLQGESLPAFVYKNRGELATIGRGAAVADVKGWRFSGYFAWLMWLFIHLFNIVQFQNRLLVLLQWGWSYVTRNRSARLITGPSPFPLSRQCELSDALEAREVASAADGAD